MIMPIPHLVVSCTDQEQLIARFFSPSLHIAAHLPHVPSDVISKVPVSIMRLSPSDTRC